MRRLRSLPALALAFVGLAGCPKQEPAASAPAAAPAPAASAPAAAPALRYPEARRGDVVDDYFGTKVPDPYRWLEDPDSPETRAWIEAENRLTRSFLDAIPERAAIRDRLTALYDHERYGLPFRAGDRFFYQHNDGLQDQSVLLVADGPDAEPRVLIDPNTFSEDGTVALAGTAPSWDGRYLAYGTSDGGSDWHTWKVRDVETGEDLADEIRWTKWGRPAWTHDGAGFFYTRYPAPDNPLEQVNEHHRIYWHALGTAQDDDVLVLDVPEHPTWGFDIAVSDDGRWLVINQGEGTENMNRLWAWRIDEGAAAPGRAPLSGEMVRVVDDYRAAFWVVGNEGDRFWAFSNDGAPKGKVVALDFSRPEAGPVDVIPEGEDAVEQVTMVGGRIFVRTLHDAASRVRVYEKDGALVGEIPLPGLGSAWGFGGRPDDEETWFAYGDFTTPTTIYRADVRDLSVELYRRPKLDFDPDAYVTEQVFYTSKDGTRIPMFIVHKKGVKPDGNRPVLLYGYGGFNISITPWFKVRNLVWLEMGGVYASANIRGGGEYGEAWHEAGTRKNKQNVFDDFIAAGEYLVDSGWTNSDRLAIHGASNGGLLIGACLVQRPDLWGAALPSVGVLDMLRYHRFTIGWAWASDYGRSDKPDMFPYLLKYSPYHNVREGTAYPPTLITTGDHDDRVVPAHSFKFAAALQHAQAGPDPILIRIETRAGHGAGKSTSMQIDEYADQWAFLLRELGMGLPEGFGGAGR